MNTDLEQQPWTPPTDRCSRCGTPTPAKPSGWVWNAPHDDVNGELVCPRCETPAEVEAMLDYIAGRLRENGGA